MKRIISFLLCGALALPAMAQGWQDALLFSENVYGGTARSVGMGNAMTALGGDPGSLTFNPAGSAVASYSQVFLTPGLSISVANTSEYIEPGQNATGFGDKVSTGYTRAKMPNMGVIFRIPSGRRSGYKGMSFGFVVNSTGDYTGRMVASGLNDSNSYSGSLASSAWGYSHAQLTEGWYANGDVYHSPAWWTDMVGYQSFMYDPIAEPKTLVLGQPISTYAGIADRINSDGSTQPQGTLEQQYGAQTKGYKYDMLFNWAIDFSDKFYVGANIGVTSLSYSMNEYWQENPENPADFAYTDYDGTMARFASLMMKRNYSVKGTGTYFKVGVLWRPVGGLRVAAAVQTPTVLRMTERTAYKGQVTLTGKNLSQVNTPENEWSYALVSPFRANLGVAWALGSVAVLSADYEMANYAHCRFNGISQDYDWELTSGGFGDTNKDIKDILGVSNTLRLGVEVKPIPQLSLRAGYNYISSPQRNNKYWDMNTEKWAVSKLSAQELAAMAKHYVSLGAGWSWGSLYADFAVQMRLVPDEYVRPYSYYVYDVSDASEYTLRFSSADGKQQAYYLRYLDADVYTPQVVTRWTHINALLTLGWRF